MKKIINYINTHKEISIIVFIVLLVVVNQFLKTNSNSNQPPSQTQEETKGVTYKSITPGTSTEDSLNKVLGSPISTKEDGGKKIIDYKSSSDYRNNQGVVENGKVVFVKQVVTLSDNIKADSITKIYGAAPNTLYQNKANSSFNLYVYPDKGIAYLGHTDGTVMEIWYFVPMSFQDFISNWGTGYSTTPSTEVLQ